MLRFVLQNAVSHHNMSYWRGRQYIGVGPGDLLSRLQAVIDEILRMTGEADCFLCVTGAHGRFVPLGEGGVAREARTQTLEPDVWIREVQQRGHGTRRRIRLGHLELWEAALAGLIMSVYIDMTRGGSCLHHIFWAHVRCFSEKRGVRGRCTCARSFRQPVLVNIYYQPRALAHCVLSLSVSNADHCVIKDVCSADWRRCWWWEWEWPRALITRWELYTQFNGKCSARHTCVILTRTEIMWFVGVFFCSTGRCSALSWAYAKCSACPPRSESFCGADDSSWTTGDDHVEVSECRSLTSTADCNKLTWSTRIRWKQW